MKINPDCLERLEGIVGGAHFSARREDLVCYGYDATAAFQDQVKQQGLFYPPDPSSSGFSTIGGNLAECAGGPKAVKYGVTRDYVLGLEAVLPSGEIVKTEVRTAKEVVGYDLTRLIVGSEGTLALITEATPEALEKANQAVDALFDTTLAL